MIKVSKTKREIRDKTIKNRCRKKMKKIVQKKRLAKEIGKKKQQLMAVFPMKSVLKTWGIKNSHRVNIIVDHMV